MVQQEFTRHMTFLGMAYGKEFTPEQVAVWYTFFADTDSRMFLSAVKRLIIKSRFMPSIADLKDELVNVATPELQLDAEVEWQNALRTVSLYGSYREEEAMASLKPITAETIRRLGGFRVFCMDEDIGWLRKNFIDMFNAYLTRERQIVSTPEVHRTENEIVGETIPQIEVKKEPEPEPEPRVEPDKIRSRIEELGRRLAK